ncbi:HNH endonuclease [Flammeovirga sp. OC4]|uniref:HNH endonuclease n=1 Tax=Flammeovirga sp. OC4 TaxID=1382345 RepID=UPI0006945A07|nr:HNH endonuclease signature motif containing protein [Flammeovirga sp. OC4]
MPYLKKENASLPWNPKRDTKVKGSGWTSTGNKKYKSYKWQQFRKSIFAERGGICETEGCYKKGNVLDHIQPVRLAPERFFDESNVQILCESCHNSKSAKERL